ncbi:MFS transporter [Corynebacterium lizhenjunii]|uniref:MFS transporter n=1 Tax=Corynebacterium lizhenjunii TaxID=2709394 RepID=UPI0013E9C740|nr:MFS transporter [Corynebacterium lizhenjunii]
MVEERVGPVRYVVGRIWPIVITQACVATGVGLNLTVASLATVQATGDERFGGLAQTCTIIGAMVLTIVATQIAARWGRIISLRFTIIFAIAGSVVCALAVGLGNRGEILLFLGLFLLGGGTVSALSARFAAVDKLGSGNDSTAAAAIAVVLMGSAIGSAVGPNLYGLFAEWDPQWLTPMQMAFAGSAVLFMLALAPLVAERRRSYMPVGYRGRSSLKKVRVQWNRNVITVFLVAAFNHSAMIALMTMAPLHTDHLFGPAGSGLVMTAHLLGMYAFGIWVSKALSKIGPQATLLLGAVILVGSAAALIVLHHLLIFFILGLFGVGLAWSIGMITTSSLVSRVSDVDQRVALQGGLDFAINVAAGISSLSAGLIVAAVGYPVLAAIVLVTACSLILLFALVPGPPGVASDGWEK